MSSKRRALILGIGGQDGSFLAEHLLKLDYDVSGLYRRSSVDNLWRIKHIIDKVTLYQGDLADHSSVVNCLVSSYPQEIYNLADQDDEGWSNSVPDYNMDITAGAVGRLMEWMKYNTIRECKFLQPISAKIFGTAPAPQNENTLLNPQSPYACAKAHAYHLTKMYRAVYRVQVSNVILYNHDSPRRGPNYLLQTICRKALEVLAGKSYCIRVGNPDAMVDVGYAGDYVVAMHAALQKEQSDDYVICTGQPRTIREFATTALSLLGISNVPIVAENGFKRPGLPESLIGDGTKAILKLGFMPATSHVELISMILKQQRGSVQL